MKREFLSILDRRFKYTPASKTDIRVLFDRIRKEQQIPKRPANGKR